MAACGGIQFPGAFTLTLKGTYLGAETTVPSWRCAGGKFPLRGARQKCRKQCGRHPRGVALDEGADIDAEVTATTYNTEVASVTGRLPAGTGLGPIVSCFGLVELPTRTVRVAQESYTCVAGYGD